MAADRYFGLFMLVTALGYILNATTIQDSFITDPVGPRVFPYIIGGAIVLSAIAMIVKPDPDAEWPGLSILVQLAIALAVLLGYAFLIKPLGFIATTVLASGILAYQISHRPFASALTGVGLGVGLFVLFRFVLGLSLQGLPQMFIS